MRKDLRKKTEKAILNLFDLAKQCCWNKISTNCQFIISEIKNLEGGDFLKQRIQQKKINDKKIPVSLNEILYELQNIYESVYDLNFYIYHAKKNTTIIEIQYYSKKSLNKGDFEILRKNQPMFHSKIRNPLYQKKQEKFDVNWEQGGWRHNWKMFWWKINYYRLKLRRDLI